MQQTETLNQGRKLQQLELKKTLAALEGEWKATVRKNVAIEAECAALEARIAGVRKEKGYVVCFCVWGIRLLTWANKLVIRKRDCCPTCV